MTQPATNHDGNQLALHFHPKTTAFPPLSTKKGSVTCYNYGIMEEDEKPSLICSFRGDHAFQIVSLESWNQGLFKADSTLGHKTTVASDQWPLPGSVWEHRKGNRYHVKGVAFPLENNDPYVVYGDLDGKYPFYWLRKVVSWNEIVDGFKRFTRKTDLEDNSNVTT